MNYTKSFFVEDNTVYLKLIKYLVTIGRTYKNLLFPTVKVTDSEVLNIPKVSRLHMGAYLCIASNEVPPSVSKRITLKVQCEYKW